MIEQVEIGWCDQHGDRGHVLLGRDAVTNYAPPGIDGPLATDVVGIVEVSPAESPGSWTTLAVYLPRAEAETLYAALGRVLNGSD